MGKAVRDSGIPREEIFITSKLWLQDYGYEAAKKGLETSLGKLGMDYIDRFDFELSEDEMETIRGLDIGKGSHDPEAPGVAEMLLANYKIHD